MAKTFAVLSGTQVSNIIVATSKKIAEDLTNSICVEYTTDNPAGIGWTYDGEVFIAPEVIADEA